MEYRSRSKTSVISGCGMLIRGVVKFSARNCHGINFRKVGNYVYRSSITDVKRRYTEHCKVNKMADSSGLGPGKFITLLTL